jgi:hypothetical protein
MKICSKCKIKRNLEEFQKRKVSKDGRRGQCNDCYLPDMKIYMKQYYQDNKENLDVVNGIRTKQHYLDNKETTKKRHKEWQLNNRYKCNKYTLTIILRR